MLERTFVQVVVDKPLVQGFDYIWDGAILGGEPAVGQIVEVPFGRSNAIGVVIKVSGHSAYEEKKLKAVTQKAPLPPLDSNSLALLNFVSHYYLSALGETILPTVPAYWKKSKRWLSLGSKTNKESGKKKTTPLMPDRAAALQTAVDKVVREDQLNPDQRTALSQLVGDPKAKEKYRCILLQGRTGSGKTAVYLNWVKTILEKPKAQVLILVPEINLTPQLERRIHEFFPDKQIAVMHSGLSEKQRGMAWQETMEGRAQLILGTRLAAMSAIPNLSGIVIDEEHDASYKQQEGTRYSARDLSIWRAHHISIPILLSSATPSLETWIAAQEGRYELIRLDKRALSTEMPTVKLVKLNNQNKKVDQHEAELISLELRNAINTSYAERKQSLVLINRRGYAPILHCAACGWLSGCTKCSSYMVLHKASTLGKKTVLNCHHCGLIQAVPEYCPDCGNAELSSIGQGTQKMEDYIHEKWPNARVLRIDADSSKKSKGAEALFEQIHDGRADIIVGTQMIAKGHDYQNIGLVGVVDADSRLYSQDFRAPERLFAQLVQVAGRAGRANQEKQNAGTIYVETRYPDSPVFQYLLAHDVDGFLKYTAIERKEALLPPFSYQALVHAEGKSVQKAIQFLTQLKKTMREKMDFPNKIRMYDPVPKTIVRVSGSERAQLLIECDDRKELQLGLEKMDQELRSQSQGRISSGTRIRWLIERDPALI